MCLGRAVAHLVESGPIYTEGTTANSCRCQPMSAPRARLAAQCFGHPQIQGIHSHPLSPVTLIETVRLFGVILRGTESTKQKGKEATEQFLLMYSSCFGCSWGWLSFVGLWLSDGRVSCENKTARTMTLTEFLLVMDVLHTHV